MPDEPRALTTEQIRQAMCSLGIKDRDMHLPSFCPACGMPKTRPLDGNRDVCINVNCGCYRR